MVLVADELKRKRAEIAAKIEELRPQIVSLEQQQASFDVVIQAYEPEYSPAGTHRAAAPGKVPSYRVSYRELNMVSNLSGPSDAVRLGKLI